MQSLYVLRFPQKNNVRFVFTSCCLYEGSCLIYVSCVCLRIVLLCVCLIFFRLCCQFVWIVHFWFSLQYSLTFIRLIGIVNDKTIKVHCHHSGFWLLYWNNKYEVLRALITLMETLRKIEVSKNGTTQTLPGYF